MLDVVQDDSTDAGVLQKRLLPHAGQLPNVEDLDVADEALPEAESLILKVVDYELEELEALKDLAQLLLWLETLAFEPVEDAEAPRQVVDHLVAVVVQHIRENESLLVLVDEESLQLACLLDEDAA